MTTVRRKMTLIVTLEGTEDVIGKARAALDRLGAEAASDVADALWTHMLAEYEADDYYTLTVSVTQEPVKEGKDVSDSLALHAH